ncbi:Haloacid dehydrogenase [Pandoravirus salinus]|uniref:Haloacid dehydrogenase n=1 Tax=Pandoravirus salinus TaxID=1349410 RepID=A0A291ATJ5_9VIRU|nr:Haloacid dehydrogenase [Pandoravirus salinus]ATE82117.1 Haloacid dehydrogenase [Pandoravirus salinus]
MSSPLVGRPRPAARLGNKERRTVYCCALLLLHRAATAKAYTARDEQKSKGKRRGHRRSARRPLQTCRSGPPAGRTPPPLTKTPLEKADRPLRRGQKNRPNNDPVAQMQSDPRMTQQTMLAGRRPLPLPPTNRKPSYFMQTAAAAIDGVAALALSTIVSASRTLGDRDDDAIERYMTGGTYDRALDHAVSVGYAAIHARLSALRADAATSRGPAPVPLVVFDVDDTLLSTRRDHFGRPATIAGSCAAATQDASLPPLDPVVGLYRRLWSDGVRTAVVTGRWASERDRTLTNLCRAGVGGWDHALFRTPGARDAYMSARAYKRRQRARLVAAGYEIVGVVGDQHSDMAYDVPSVVNVKLPNPMYTLY